MNRGQASGHRRPQAGGKGKHDLTQSQVVLLAALAPFEGSEDAIRGPAGAGGVSESSSQENPGLEAPAATIAGTF